MAAPTRRPLLFSAFVMNTTSHIVQGTWRRPDAGQTDFHSLEHWVRGMVTDREPVVRDLGLLMAHNNRVAGTPEQIADRLAQWRDAGVDGINVVNVTRPGSYEEFVEHVTPVLQERGLQQREYTDGTLRNKVFGTDLLPDRHPAARYRGAFAAAPAAEPVPVA